MLIEGGYVSADSHVVEPADLWLTRMDKRFCDRAPRVDQRPWGDYYLIDGLEPVAVGLEGAALEDKLQGGIENPKGRHGNTRPGAWDPQIRLVDQDLDHVRAEVVHPGLLSLQFFYLHDAEYQRAVIQVYNDWLSEFCSAAPTRLLGAALLPMRGPVEWACEEAERVTKLGLRSVMIPADSADKPYGNPDYNPLWEKLQDVGLPVVAHSGTGIGETPNMKLKRMGPAMGVTEEKIFLPMKAMADLIWGAVPQRYPKLRFVMAEGGIGWIASLLGFMDHWWTDHHRWMQPKLDEKPSFYFRRQFWATFEEDRAGLLTRELIGVDRIMWGADYPHTEGTFPYSQQQIAKDFVGIPEDEIYQMVVKNAAQVYGLEVGE